MGKFKKASDINFQMVPEELQLRFPGLKKKYSAFWHLLLRIISPFDDLFNHGLVKGVQ